MRLRLFAVLVLLVPYLAALAQGLGDLLKAPPYPETMKATEIPEGYRAVQIRTSAYSPYDTLSTLMGFPMMIGGATSPETDARVALIDAAQASWTKGDIVKMDSGEFLVTYRIGVDAGMVEGQTVLPATLKLTFVRKDAIVEITPRGDLTRERMAQLFSGKESRTPSISDKAKALSNIKQLALGAIIYSSDYDDVMPYAQDTKSAFAVMYPYVKNASIFASGNPSGSRILLNMAISGAETTEVPEPATTVMFYDEKPWPDGTRPVAFMDGHAKMVDTEEWRRVESSLHLKLKRKARPLPPNYWKQVAPNLDIGGS